MVTWKKKWAKGKDFEENEKNERLDALQNTIWIKRKQIITWDEKKFLGDEKKKKISQFAQNSLKFTEISLIFETKMEFPKFFLISQNYKLSGQPWLKTTQSNNKQAIENSLTWHKYEYTGLHIIFT